MPENQENPRSNNPEISPEWLEETYFEATYPDAHTRDEVDWDVQQSAEQAPNELDQEFQRVATYLGSLMERGVLGGDPEEYGQEYLQAMDNMNQITDIETRVHQGEELTALDVYFLREYGGQIQSFGSQKDPRIDELLQDRDPEADLDMMLKNFDQYQLARDMIYNGTPALLVQNLDKFLQSEVDPGQLAQDLIDSGVDGMEIFADNLEKFQLMAGDQFQLARDLLESGLIGKKILAENLDKFQFMAVDQAQLVRDMMRSGMARNLAEHLDKFPGGALDHARELMDSRGEYSLARHLDQLRDAAADVRD